MLTMTPLSCWLAAIFICRVIECASSNEWRHQGQVDSHWPVPTFNFASFFLFDEPIDSDHQYLPLHQLPPFWDTVQPTTPSSFLLNSINGWHTYPFWLNLSVAPNLLLLNSKVTCKTVTDVETRKVASTLSPATPGRFNIKSCRLLRQVAEIMSSRVNLVSKRCDN